MKNIRYFIRQYIDWVIKLGRVKFSLLGVVALALLALCTHIFLSLVFVGEIHWRSLIYAISFGLISAPFVIYFFTLLVEKLELSRLRLFHNVIKLRIEIQDRISAERRLEQANQDKTTLMATISHELRTPLNGIVGLSRILLDTPLTQEQRNYLNTINFSAVALGYIFNDIIDLEKIDASRISLYERETDLVHLLNDIENIGRFMAQQKGLKFSLMRGQNLPHYVMLDGTRLSQVLWNLLSNAVKFTEKGEICVDIQRISENQLQFSVKDTGLGIPESDLQNIFAMYYQVAENQHKPAGSGIGLSISKSIAQLMQGDLTVSSQLGLGTTFTLTIQAQEIQPSIKMDMQPLAVSGLRVLLVEDIELNIVVAKSVLEKLGCSIDTAMTGNQAFDLFDKNQYDLVLLDIQLPDMTGFNLASHWRQGYENGVYDYLPPLIALTANVMQSKAEYQAQGMDDVLRKPLDFKALNQCLTEYFGEMLLPAQDNSQYGNQSAVDFQAEFEATTQDQIDYDFVRDLMQFIEAESYLSNLKAFQQEMQTDALNLSQAYERYIMKPALKNELTETAHKVKGAAGSLGLKKIQELANLIQQGEIPEWQTKLEQWIDDITKTMPTSVNLLQDWLERYQEYSGKK